MSKAILIDFKKRQLLSLGNQSDAQYVVKKVTTAEVAQNWT